MKCGQALAITIAAVSIVTCSRVPSNDAGFSFSSDPSEEVLQIRTTFDLGGSYYVYTLVGDGQLEYRHMARGGVVRKRTEARLSFEEMEALLRVGFESRLFDCSNSSELYQRVTEASVAKYSKAPSFRVADGTDVILEVHLTSNSRGAGLLRYKFRVHALGVIHEVLPEVAEIEGMVAIYRSLRSYTQPEG